MCWCECLLQRELPPGLSSPSVPLPTYPCPGALSITPGFVCASSQGRRWSQMGGGLAEGEMVTAGLIWAPREKRLLTQEELGKKSRAEMGEGNCVW